MNVSQGLKKSTESIFLYCSLENQEFIDATAQLFQLLESNNQATRNTSSLLRVFLSRATELKASAQCDK